MSAAAAVCDAPTAPVWAEAFDEIAQIDDTLAMALTAQRDAIIDHDFAAARKCAELILERLKFIDERVRSEFIREVERTFKPAVLGGGR